VNMKMDTADRRGKMFGRREDHKPAAVRVARVRAILALVRSVRGNERAEFLKRDINAVIQHQTMCGVEVETRGAFAI
jgi:hypothetical protein